MLGYKVKRGSTSTTDLSIKNMLLNFFKRVIVALVILALIVVGCYFLFQFLSSQFPEFSKASEDVIKFVKDFYEKYGLWATIGGIIFVCLAVWALGEELKRKDRQKDAMKHMMK
jgi:magnesium-transporting ATPase (P-type)